MRLDKAHAFSLMNIPYAVMFGVIFTFSFYLSSQPKFHVTPAVSSENVWLFGTLLAYFHVSWATANYMIIKRDYTFVHIFSWVMAIWYLGVTVVMSNGVGPVKYLLLSSYIIVVGTYDFVAYRNIWYRRTTLPSIIWMVLAGITIIFGLRLLLPTFLNFMDVVKVEINLHRIALNIAAIFLIIRSARLAWILRGGQI